MKKIAPPNYLFISLVTLLARDFQILRFYGNRGYTNTTLRLNCSWDGVSSHLFSCLFSQTQMSADTKKKGNPKLQYSSQNQLDEVSHWYPYPRQAAKFGNFVTLFEKDGNFIYQNLFDPVQPFFAFLQSFGSYCYHTEAQYSTSFYWQNAQNRIVIQDRYIILIFIWMNIIICCLQKIPRSV